MDEIEKLKAKLEKQHMELQKQCLANQSLKFELKESTSKFLLKIEQIRATHDHDMWDLKDKLCNIILKSFAGTINVIGESRTHITYKFKERKFFVHKSIILNIHEIINENEDNNFDTY